MHKGSKHIRGEHPLWLILKLFVQKLRENLNLSTYQQVKKSEKKQGIIAKTTFKVEKIKLPSIFLIFYCLVP